MGDSAATSNAGAPSRPVLRRKRRYPQRVWRTHAPTRRGRGPSCGFLDASGGAGVPGRGGQASGRLHVYTGRFKEGVSAALIAFPLPAVTKPKTIMGHSASPPASLWGKD